MQQRLSYDLQNALAVFRLKNLSLKRSETVVKAEQLDNIPAKYFMQQYERNDPENQYGLLIRQQYGERYTFKNRQEKLDNQKRISAVILEKEVVNPLGMSDLYYYYIIHRKKLLTSWSRALELKKFGNFAKGFYLPFYVLKHIEKNQNREFCTLVLIVDNEHHLDEYQTYMTKATVLNEFFLSNKMPLLINAYGEYTTAFPIDIMKEVDTIE